MSDSRISPIDYEQIHTAVHELCEEEQKVLPLTAVNDKNEDVIISSGTTDDGIHYYRIDTMQSNGWIRVNGYYADGTVTETYER